MSFENQLKRGLQFERGGAINVLHKLYPNHLIMNNQVDPTETTGGNIVGPRLYRGMNREEEFVAPDFVMFDQNGNASWIDAKLKGAAWYDRKTGQKYFTIDPKKHRQYSQFPGHILHNFWLLFKNEETSKMYFAKFQENPAMMFFNNQYGTGESPMYYLKDLAKVKI